MNTGTGGPHGGETATAPAQVPVSAPHGPLSMTHKEMDSARARGEATPLAAGVTWLARYQGAWWIAYEGRWLLVTDEPLHADLDRISSRLASAESATVRLRILSQSLGIIATLGEADEQV